MFANARKNRANPWVIGGHRGRLHADNAGEFHDFLRLQTEQPIVWIANAPLAYQMQKQGMHVLVRNTWKARLAILRASVQIYSHGEDDIDQYAILWRKRLGLRVHLNHCMNHIKAGQMYRKDIESFGLVRKALFRFTMIDFDLLPASSELEKAHFALSLPHLRDHIVVGGGAHIDGIMRIAQEPTDRRILWFPTFRDTPTEKKNLDRIIAEVAADERLHAWLQSENRVLYICHHINSGTAQPIDVMNQSSSSIRFCSPATLTLQLSKAELFISDYSGIVADWIITERPIVLFAFDLETYLKSRSLYIPYEQLAYGPIVKDSAQLIETLISNSWQNQNSFHERREHWKSLMFPLAKPRYAERTYETICKHLDF
jgi:hypothetical protein